MGNKVVKKEEAVKEVAFIEFGPAYEVVLKAGSQIKQVQTKSNKIKQKIEKCS